MLFSKCKITWSCINHPFGVWSLLIYFPPFTSKFLPHYCPVFFEKQRGSTSFRSSKTEGDETFIIPKHSDPHAFPDLWSDCWGLPCPAVGGETARGVSGCMKAGRCCDKCMDHFWLYVCPLCLPISQPSNPSIYMYIFYVYKNVNIYNVKYTMYIYIYHKYNVYNYVHTYIYI